LKCEILRKKHFFRSSFGVPHRSIVLSILANIYYNELDKWIEEKGHFYTQP